MSIKFGHGLVLWGPSSDGLVPDPDRLRGPSLLCVRVTVRCLLPCPLSHWVVGRLFNCFLLLFYPGRRITLADGFRHTPTQGKDPSRFCLSADHILARIGRLLFHKARAGDLCTSPSTVDLLLPTWEALIYSTSCVLYRLGLRQQPLETTRAFVSFLLPYLCHLPVSLQPDYAPEGASDMIRCSCHGGMSNDFSKRNGPCMCARLQALPARFLVRRFVASGLPSCHHTPALCTGTGMPGILSELSAPGWLDSKQPSGTTPASASQFS